MFIKIRLFVGQMVLPYCLLIMLCDATFAQRIPGPAEIPPQGFINPHTLVGAPNKIAAMGAALAMEKDRLEQAAADALLYTLGAFGRSRYEEISDTLAALCNADIWAIDAESAEGLYASSAVALPIPTWCDPYDTPTNTSFLGVLIHELKHNTQMSPTGIPDRLSLEFGAVECEKVMADNLFFSIPNSVISTEEYCDLLEEATESCESYQRQSVVLQAADHGGELGRAADRLVDEFVALNADLGAWWDRYCVN